MASRTGTDADGDVDGADGEVVRVEATVEQVLNGVRVGLDGASGVCAYCGRELHDGDCVTVYAYRKAGHDTWNCPRVYCRDCRSGDGVSTPTLGTTEVTATAFLGVMQVAAQTTRLALTNVELESYSRPSDGSEGG
ncbi:hypothetical protein [Halorussus caseinilyticus]|uniref:DUF8112 domain-containing protein n=1 Tax=Halorussus caseinilyticus TaxID=3034025 RepID=A0ABD5WJS9_9EURY|nr:hypothetical protein [Halorussus sp. DT72]